MIYTIHYKFTYLNEYIYAERSNRYKGAKIKRDTTQMITYMLMGKPKIKTPCKITYTHLLENKRRDIDNLSIVAKYFQDAMVKAKLIKNDNVNNIVEITHKFIISDKVGVEVEIEEV